MNKNRNKGIGIAKRLLVMPLMAMLFIGGSNEVFAQWKNVIGLVCSNTISSKVLTDVDVIPEYPGGSKDLGLFLDRNLVYPTEAMENGIRGCVVVKYLVQKDGSVGDVQVETSVHPLLDKEAVRVIKSIRTKFKPGTRGGEPVDVWCTMPIDFRLMGDYEASPASTDKSEVPSNKEMKSGDQDKASLKKPEVVFTPVEQKAEYPGGNRALQQFFATNIQIPAEAIEKGLSGRVVVQFKVKKDGCVGEVKIQKSVHPLLDNEAIRLVKSIPHKFKPGKMNGASVNMWYTTGINFVAAVSDKE